MRQAGHTGTVIHGCPVLASRSAAPLRHHHHRAAAAARPSASPSMPTVSTLDPPHLTPGRTSRCLGFFGTAARSFKRAAVTRSSSSIACRQMTGVPARITPTPAVFYEALVPLLHAQRALPTPAGTTGAEQLGGLAAASHSVAPAPIRRRHPYLRSRRRRPRRLPTSRRLPMIRHMSSRPQATTIRRAQAARHER